MNLPIKITAMKMNSNLLNRTIFGAIYVAIIVCGILCGPFVLLVLQLLLSTLAVNEFLAMTTPSTENPETAATNLLLRSYDCVGAALIVITVWTGQLFLPGLVIYLLYIVLRLTMQLHVKNADALQSLSHSFMSQLYVALPIALMSVVYRISPHLLLLLFILVWVNDTFAYLCGITFGRHKLWERISPKKTWEGFCGGVLFTVIISTLCGVWFSRYFGGFGPVALGFTGLVVGVAGTYGDLIESLIKRTCRVKDSGHLIPGHGGILDRIDSILLVIPVALILFHLIYSYGF